MSFKKLSKLVHSTEFHENKMIYSRTHVGKVYGLNLGIIMVGEVFKTG